LEGGEMTPYQFELLKSLQYLADLLNNMSDEEFNERYEKRKASLEQERALDKLLKDGGEK
jgi:hypothetical protein